VANTSQLFRQISGAVIRAHCHRNHWLIPVKTREGVRTPEKTEMTTGLIWFFVIPSIRTGCSHADRLTPGSKIEKSDSSPTLSAVFDQFSMSIRGFDFVPPARDFTIH